MENSYKRWRALRRKYGDMMNLGIEPNVVTFTTLIKGWCKVGKMSVAMHVTKVMLKMGIYPSEFTYVL